MTCRNLKFRCVLGGLLIGLSVSAHAQEQEQLQGPTWVMVKFQSMDDSVMTPTRPADYTLTFEDRGRLRIRADCNRGVAGWRSGNASELRIGHMVVTRALCMQGSMSTRFLRDLDFVRSYTFRDGHLFLALKADAGIYEFRPMSQ